MFDRGQTYFADSQESSRCQSSAVTMGIYCNLLTIWDRRMVPPRSISDSRELEVSRPMVPPSIRPIVNWILSFSKSPINTASPEMLKDLAHSFAYADPCTSTFDRRVWCRRLNLVMFLYGWEGTSGHPKVGGPRICQELDLGNSLRWFVALCINQKDNVEKCHQVPMMRKIYQASEQTIVYLGELAGYRTRRRLVTRFS